MFPLFSAEMGDNEIWVIASWRQYENGERECLSMRYLGPRTTEAEAHKAFREHYEHLGRPEENLRLLLACVELSEEELADIEEQLEEKKFGPPDPKLIEEWDLYQARLKVLAGLTPKTVELMKKAEAETDQLKRKAAQRTAVQAYFAETRVAGDGEHRRPAIRNAGSD